jgi:hypothetical protein
VRPLTGAPRLLGREAAQLDGVTYRRLYTYQSRVTRVLGEFYWRVERGQVCLHTDYQGTGRDAHRRLNREETRSADGSAHEVVWSAGETLDADPVLRAFGVATAASPLRRDVRPTSDGGFLPKLFVGLFFLALLFAMVRCSSDDCAQVRTTFGEASQEYQSCRSGSSPRFRTSGGSWGGFSTGGGHK